MGEIQYLDKSGLEYFAQKVDTQLDGKVNVETGKGLSTNDYTTAEKQALAKVIQDVSGIVATGGQANVIETVKLNGTALPVTDKAVNVDLSDYALKSDIVTAMDWKGSKATYAELPEEDNNIGDIWHVTEKSAEYAWDGSAWQELGSIIDLSTYYTKSETNSAISAAVSGKANSADVYTKAEANTAISNAISGKVDTSYVNEELAKKANSSDVYTKTEANNLLIQKANAAETYNKTEVNNLLAAKANTADFVPITNAEIDALFTA